MSIETSKATYLPLPATVLREPDQALDYWVAQAAQIDIKLYHAEDGDAICILRDGTVWSPTVNPTQAWPLITELGIGLKPHVVHSEVVTSWQAFRVWPMPTDGDTQLGNTGLIAAMRQYLSIHLNKQTLAAEHRK